MTKKTMNEREKTLRVFWIVWGIVMIALIIKSKRYNSRQQQGKDRFLCCCI